MKILKITRWGILLLVIGCSGFDGLFTDKTAPTISYSSDSYTFTRYVAVTVTPTLGRGVPTSCVASPVLPAGLSLDNKCTISLNPDINMTEMTDYTEYAITATNAYGSATVTLRIKVVIDEDPPTVHSSTPGGNATDVPTTSAVITVVFSEPMKNLTPTLITEACSAGPYPNPCDNGGWIAIPNNNGTTITWTNSTTLRINLSWVYFPETTQLRWGLSTDKLQDLAGNEVAGSGPYLLAEVGGDDQEYLVGTFTTTARNTYFKIADTGQTTCYDDQAPAANCGQTSDNYPSQDADFPNTPNARSFTVSTSGGATVTDNITELVWKKCTEGQLYAQGSSNCRGQIGDNFGADGAKANWYDAINVCSAWNSGTGYAGRKNWRLPTLAELESLPNYGANAPAIDENHFPETVAGSYWSASSKTTEIEKAYLVDFDNGGVVAHEKDESLYVRCVSGGGSTPQSFVNGSGANDGTVFDNATKLRWQKCSAGQEIGTGSNCQGVGVGPDFGATSPSWQDALMYCQNLNDGAGYAGRTTWRLPNINELKSLIDRARTTAPFINPVFQAFSEGYWSSSTPTSEPGGVWQVEFNLPSTLQGVGKDGEARVRCVTDGP